MKSNTVYKQALNRMLAIVATLEIGSELGSETTLAQHLAVSRTTLRAVLASLQAAGVVTIAGAAKSVVRHPTAADFYPELETESARVVVEKKFMAWILHGDCVPGQHINGLELARQFGVSTSTIREYLNHFSRFGLIERRPNTSWVFKGFTPAFALELCELRELLELCSAHKFTSLAPDHPTWLRLSALEREHIALLGEISTRFRDFSELDGRFHRLVYDTAGNRFFVDFYDVLAMIFHYHYQWSKVDEKERNVVAIGEHLVYIAALKSRDGDAIAQACSTHMATARATLLRSISHGKEEIAQ